MEIYFLNLQFSAIAVKDRIASSQAAALRWNTAGGGRIDDLDFFIGDEALSPAAANYSVKVRQFISFLQISLPESPHSSLK